MKVNSNMVLFAAGALALYVVSQRATAAGITVTEAGRNALNPARPDNIVNSTVEYLTGFSLFDTGEKLGGYLYKRWN